MKILNKIRNKTRNLISKKSLLIFSMHLPEKVYNKFINNKNKNITLHFSYDQTNVKFGKRCNLYILIPRVPFCITMAPLTEEERTEHKRNKKDEKAY